MNLSLYDLTIELIQNLVLNTVKEAHDCHDHQGEQVYYCIPHVRIDNYTSDEDVSLLFKMIIQNNSAYLKFLYMVKDICLLSSQYHSLLSCISSATNLTALELGSISCQTHGSSDRLSVLDLHKHHKLRYLRLGKIPLSCLLLPNQEETQFSWLHLDKLSMSHDNLVQLCKSLSFLVGLTFLHLNDLSCSDHGGSCPLPVLGLDKHHKLEKLVLQKIPLSCLLLPSQEETQFSWLHLDKLSMSHDNLVQLCKSLSFLVGLMLLYLNDLSCSDHDGSCPLSVLGLQRHHKLEKLKLDNTSISGLLLPGQEESRIKYLDLHNLVLSHDSLVQLCSSISSSFVLRWLKLTNLRCYDHDDLTNLSCSEHSGRCRLKSLNLYSHHELEVLSLDKISISWLLIPSLDGLDNLELNNMALSHDNLVQLCSTLSYLSALKRLKLTSLRCNDHVGMYGAPISDRPSVELENVHMEQIPVEDLSALSGLENLQLTMMPCSEHSGICNFTVLDLHKHYRLRELKLDTSSIGGIILPRPERHIIPVIGLRNLVLSHYSLQQLCTSLSDLSDDCAMLQLNNLSCSDHSGSCFFPLLNLHDTELNYLDILSDTDSSDDYIDSDSNDSDK